MQFLPKVGQFVLAASASFDFEKFAESELVEVENFLIHLRKLIVDAVATFGATMGNRSLARAKKTEGVFSALSAFSEWAAFPCEVSGWCRHLRNLAGLV